MFRLSTGDDVVNNKTEEQGGGLEPRGRTDRRLRADAQRNIEALLRSAMTVFATSGVDAPVREIAEKAGVGIGTVYRHFPQRSDLIVGVFRHEVNACADAAAVLATEHEPGEALARWMQRYVDFISAKRGLATALHSGNPAYETLPAYFRKRLQPALQTLLDAAAATGEVRAGVEPHDLMRAVASLCAPAHAGDPTHAHRMVALLVDGLRYGASVSGRTSKKRLHPRPHQSKLNANRSGTDTSKNMPPGNKESYEDRG
jgi:AcrR family transcriptional regulator